MSSLTPVRMMSLLCLLIKASRTLALHAAEDAAAYQYRSFDGVRWCAQVSSVGKATIEALLTEVARKWKSTLGSRCKSSLVAFFLVPKLQDCVVERQRCVGECKSERQTFTFISQASPERVRSASQDLATCGHSLLHGRVSVAFPLAF